MKGSLKKTSAIFVGLILSVPLAIFGFLAYQNVSTRASDSVPFNVIINNITNTSATITWDTDQPTQGVIEYGTSPTSLVFFAPEAQKLRKHEVELTLLTPKTPHYFQIRVENEVYDNNGAPWTFTTKAAGETDLEATPSASVAPEVTESPSIPTEEPEATPDPFSSPDPGVTQAQQPTLTPAQPSPTPNVFSCDTEPDCQKVLQKLNKGCSTDDYVRCIKRSVPTPSFTPVPETDTPTPTKEPDDTTATPTVTPAASPTP